jgi:metal-responsive CopG/Arc/MetJ family transcriptional regulator
MVNTQKVNFTMPEDVARDLKTRIRKSKRSSFVAEAVREKLDALQAEQLRQELTEGYKARLNENEELSKEWDHTIADGLDDK